MKIAFFRCDITPPVGHPLCAGWCPPATGVADLLFANGVVLHPKDERPIVLCALDWAEVSNGEYDAWKAALAQAAKTSADRVTVHCVHAHDTPWPDRDAQALLDEKGYPEIIMQPEWCDDAIKRVADAVRAVASDAVEVTEIRTGRSRVKELASNRRVIGPDGKSLGVRWTQCRDEAIRSAPEGLIDPDLKTISFWNGERKLAALHYYTVHPTSYDASGMISPDFVGIARERLMKEDGVPHIYFTECAGNITAGKYNDGVADNRELFTRKIYDAMVESEKDFKRHPVGALRWKTHPVILPPREDRMESTRQAFNDPETSPSQRSRAALEMAYRRRCEAKIPIILSCLWIGEEIVSLHLPGESFIEYQLYAQSLAPKAMVVVPSYADCGPGYIPLKISYEEGGYEPQDAFCSGESEAIFRDAIRQLMQ